jgi:hypothetical protein
VKEAEKAKRGACDLVDALCFACAQTSLKERSQSIVQDLGSKPETYRIASLFIRSAVKMLGVEHKVTMAQNEQEYMSLIHEINSVLEKSKPSQHQAMDEQEPHVFSGKGFIDLVGRGASILFGCDEKRNATTYKRCSKFLIIAVLCLITPSAEFSRACWQQEVKAKKQQAYQRWQENLKRTEKEILTKKAKISSLFDAFDEMDHEEASSCLVDSDGGGAAAADLIKKPDEDSFSYDFEKDESEISKDETAFEVLKKYFNKVIKPTTETNASKNRFLELIVSIGALLIKSGCFALVGIKERIESQGGGGGGGQSPSQPSVSSRQAPLINMRSLASCITTFDALLGITSIGPASALSPSLPLPSLSFSTYQPKGEPECAIKIVSRWALIGSLARFFALDSLKVDGNQSAGDDNNTLSKPKKDYTIDAFGSSILKMVTMYDSLCSINYEPRDLFHESIGRRSPVSKREMEEKVSLVVLPMFHSILSNWSPVG